MLAIATRRYTRGNRVDIVDLPDCAELDDDAYQRCMRIAESYLQDVQNHRDGCPGLPSYHQEPEQLARSLRETIEDHASGGTEDTICAHFPGKPVEDALVLMRCLVQLGVRGRTELDVDGGFWLHVPVGSPVDSQGEYIDWTAYPCSHVVREGYQSQMVDNIKRWLDQGATEWDVAQASDTAIALNQAAEAAGPESRLDPVLVTSKSTCADTSDDWLDGHLGDRDISAGDYWLSEDTVAELAKVAGLYTAQEDCGRYSRVTGSLLWWNHAFVEGVDSFTVVPVRISAVAGRKDVRGLPVLIGEQLGKVLPKGATEISPIVMLDREVVPGQGAARDELVYTFRCRVR